jgi:hypothetical protein
MQGTLLGVSFLHEQPRTALSVANNIALALKVKNHLQGV